MERIPNSLAIEFDTFLNPLPSDDIPNDHLDIVYNGNDQIPVGNTPIPLNGIGANNIGNIEDDNWHTVAINYSFVNATQQCLTVSFDGVIVTNFCDNIIANALNGNMTAFWGFVAGTGNSNNNQIVEITKFFSANGASISGIDNLPAVNTPRPCIANTDFQLTPDLTWQTGAVWSTTQLNLNQRFVFEANVFLGDDNGADGIAFVLQDHANGINTIGRTGGNLGYGNQPGGNDLANAVNVTPSVAIELDVFNNGANFDDTAADHLDIIYNSNLNNDGIATNVGAQFANFNSVGLADLEDSSWHSIRIEWTPCADNQCLNIEIDGVLTATHCDNILDSVFNGNNLVNFGFTAGTGTQSNLQAFCITECRQIPVIQPLSVIVNDTSSCFGSFATLTSTTIGGTAPYNYAWTPNLATTQNLTNISIPGTYLLQVQDQDGCVTTDSATVSFTAPPTIRNGFDDQTICIGESISLTPTVLSVVGQLTYDWEQQNSTGIWTSAGTANAQGVLIISPTQNTSYKLTVTDINGCSSSDSLVVFAEECCPAQYNTNYLQIRADLSSTEITELSSYGINRVGSSNRFVINDGNVHLLPNKIYVENNLILQVANGSTADFTNADVVFGNCASISVNNGKVIAHNAVFRPCVETRSWSGIQIDFANNNLDALRLNECTFVNATVAIQNNYRGANPIVAEITNNLFTNCNRGINLQGFRGILLDGSISGNTFKIDNQVELISYCNQLANTNYFGIALGNLRFVDANVISQNNFIDGTSLNSNIIFEGMSIRGVRNANISTNNFTNNDRAITLFNSTEVTIENNSFEVTRRSNADDQRYQVTYGGNTGNSLALKTLIKNNSFKNTADYNISNIVDATNQLYASGAIFAEGSASQLRIEGNEIDGFEIGLFIRAESNGAGSGFMWYQAVNNQIKSHLVGIYQFGWTWNNAHPSFIGCNQISTYLDPAGANSALKRRGIVFEDHRNSTGRRTTIVDIHNNCINNTNIGVQFIHNQTGGNGYPMAPIFRGNYISNYTHVGLDIINMSNTWNNRTNVQNSFISNFGGLDIRQSMNLLGVALPNPAFFSTNDHFGLDGLGNVSPGIDISGTPTPASIACGNQDLGSNTTIGSIPWCDNENVTGRGSGAIILEILTNNDISLINDFEVKIDDLYEISPELVHATVISAIDLLSSDSEVNQLMTLIHSYQWNNNQTKWLNYHTRVRFENYSIANQILATIVPESLDEEDLQALEQVKINMSIDNQLIVENNSDINTLNSIIMNNGTYREDARLLLNITLGNNPYEYAPISLHAGSQNSTTNSDASESSFFTVYPSPTKDVINVRILQSQEIKWNTLQLFDSRGRVIVSETLKSYHSVIDVSKYDQGIYMVRLIGENGEQASERFIKQ